MKKQEFKKNEERLRKLWDNLKCSNIWITGVPEGEEQEQDIENLFEQIMKENLPNLMKEIDFQEVQEAQRVPKKLDPKRNTPKHIIKLPKIKDKEKILKAAREKETVTYKGVPIRLSFRMGGQIKFFPDKVKLKEYIIAKPLLYEMLKELI